MLNDNMSSPLEQNFLIKSKPILINLAGEVCLNWLILLGW